MRVTLLDTTHLYTAVQATRNCWLSEGKSDNGGDKDKALLDRVGNKFQHKTILEFLQYVFKIDGISLSCSHQLVRHRTFSYAQMSTRYVLKKILKDVKVFDKFNIRDYCYIDENNEHLEKYFIQQMNIVLEAIQQGDDNDNLKYLLPTAFKTQIVMRCDGRNLQNFLSLRSDFHSHYEIRRLANEVFKQIPDEHKYLFEDYIQGGISNDK